MHLVKTGDNSIVQNRLSHLVLRLTGTVTLRWPLKSSEFVSNLVARLAAANWSIWRAFPGCFASKKITKQLQRIGLQSPGNGDKFHDVDAPFATLIFGNERLRSPEFPGQNLPANTGAFPHCDKKVDQPLMLVRSKCFWHLPPGQ